MTSCIPQQHRPYTFGQTPSLCVSEGGLDTRLDPMMMLVLKCSDIFLSHQVSIDVLNHTFHAILTTKPVDFHAFTVAGNHCQQQIIYKRCNTAGSLRDLCPKGGV